MKQPARIFDNAGNQAPRFPLLDDTACKKPCAADPGGTCGSTNVNQVYRLTQLATDVASPSATTFVARDYATRSKSSPSGPACDASRSTMRSTGFACAGMACRAKLTTTPQPWTANMTQPAWSWLGPLTCPLPLFPYSHPPGSSGGGTRTFRQTGFASQARAAHRCLSSARVCRR